MGAVKVKRMGVERPGTKQRPVYRTNLKSNWEQLRDYNRQPSGRTGTCGSVIPVRPSKLYIGEVVPSRESTE